MKMSKAVANVSHMNRTSVVQKKETEELKNKKEDETLGSRRKKGSVLPDVFDERKALVGKWFHKWTDAQRLAVLEDLVNHCKVNQLEQLNLMIACQKPVFHDDFTYLLPRVLSLHIFSFLDPRSLCRCSQVSWAWKSLVELDELWEPSCRRLGWSLLHVPTPFETGAWRRLYLNSIAMLKRTVSVTSKTSKELERMSLVDSHQARSRQGVPVTDQRPPWKGSDPTPRDTWRHNYLENDETLGKLGNTKTTDHRRKLLRTATGAAMRRSNSLTRSQSASFLSDNDVSWGQHNSGSAGGAPFVSRPLTVDQNGVHSTIAFDRSFSTALITHDSTAFR